MILGLLGTAGAAPASAATRGFFIVNRTQYTLTLKSVQDGRNHFGRCQGGDEFASVGTTVAPGETYRYEKVWYFNGTCKTQLTFGYTDRNGSSQDIRIDIMVLGFGERLASAQSHPHIEVSDTAGTNGQLLLTDK